VLTADDSNAPTRELSETLNYVAMAGYGFQRAAEGWPLSVTLISDLQGIVMRGTAKQAQSGQLRETHVVIGRRAEADPGQEPVEAAQFVPCPAGPQLESGLRDLVDWLPDDHAGTWIR
jgi:Fic family protein